MNLHRCENLNASQDDYEQPNVYYLSEEPFLISWYSLKLLRNFPHLGGQMFTAAFTRVRHLTPKNFVHILTLYNIHFNTILLSKLRYPNESLSFVFSMNVPPTHPPWLIELIKLGEGYKLWTSSLCNTLYRKIYQMRAADFDWIYISCHVSIWEHW
jgi:hypothetical protein